MDRTALPGLFVGLAGLAAGAGGALAGSPGLSLAAAGCAAAAGAASVPLARRWRAAEGRAVAAEGREAAAEAVAAAAAEAARADLERAEEAEREARTFVDPETGLGDPRYFGIALLNRVATARRRVWPASVVLVECLEDARPAPGVLAAVLRATLREADLACRLGDSLFGLVLDDVAEAGGVLAAERVREALGAADPAARLVAGVATYPVHGLTPTEVLTRASVALARARRAGPGGTVVVAHTTDAS